jgi:CheY-like chemotaxis protein
MTQQIFGKDCKPSCRQSVLIVDDEYMNLMGLYLVLQKLGLTPVVSNSGPKAL